MAKGESDSGDSGEILVILFLAFGFLFALKSSMLRRPSEQEYVPPPQPEVIQTPVPLPQFPPITPKLPQPGEQGGVGNFTVPKEATKKLTPKQLDSLLARIIVA